MITIQASRRFAFPWRFAVAACALACAAAAPAAATAAAPTCATSGLVVWLNTQGGGGAAGSVYYTLEFTNQSSRTCTITGYPGVSAVNLSGHQLGSPATPNHSVMHTVTLAPGATAKAVLRIVVAGNFPGSACHRVRAAGVRVYPPDQKHAKVVPFPFDACSHAGPVVLNVNAVAGN